MAPVRESDDRTGVNSAFLKQFCAACEVMRLDTDTASLVSDCQSAALFELTDRGCRPEQGMVDHPGNLVVVVIRHGWTFPSERSTAAESPFTIASELFAGICGKLPGGVTQLLQQLVHGQSGRIASCLNDGLAFV